MKAVNFVNKKTNKQTAWGYMGEHRALLCSITPTMMMKIQKAKCLCYDVELN